MRRLNLKQIISLVFVALIASCGSKKESERQPERVIALQDDVVASLDWVSVLRAGEYLAARLVFKNSRGMPLTQVELQDFDPQMPSMGHGTDTSSQAYVTVAGENGQIEVRGIYFIMGGDWVVGVTAKIDGQSRKFSFDVKVP